MSSPSFNPEKGQIWYSDGFQGFFSVKLTNGVWPFPSCKGTEATLGVYGNRAVGAGGTDVIAGRGAPERISGKGGADKVCGRAGRDRLKGGGGRDTLRGGNDNDVIAGGPGRDRIDCGRGRRDVVVGGSNDVLTRCERQR
jgi:Ca2+-binding RTX toxin-like protein